MSGPRAHTVRPPQVLLDIRNTSSVWPLASHLPRKGKAYGRLIAAPTAHRKPVRAHIMRPPSMRAGNVGSANSGAEIEPQNLEFLLTQVPVGRKRSQNVTPFLRAGTFTAL